MRVYALAVYAFLYLPIGIIALFSFSAGRSASQMQGFSVQWYGKALSNPFVIDALTTSVAVALGSALLASLCGTMAAMALTGLKGRLRTLFDALLERRQEAVLAIEHEGHFGNQREIDVLAGDRRAGGDEARVATHDLDQRNAVMHAVRLGVRAVDRLGGLLDGGDIAESARHEGDL